MSFWAQLNTPTTISDSLGNPIDAVGGAIQVTSVGGTRAGYSAVALNLVPGAAATDIFTISGSATKTLRILTLGFSATQQSSGIQSIAVIKRSAVDTGGTSTSPTAVPHDSTDSAATAVVKAYTANPSALGAAVGTLRTVKIGAPAANTSTISIVEWSLDVSAAKAIVLKGLGETLAINLNGVTPTGSSFDAYVTWTEE